MVAHLEGDKLIAKEQHGFVKNKSCLTNPLDIIDTVTDALKNGDNDNSCCIPRFSESL